VAVPISTLINIFLQEQEFYNILKKGEDNERNRKKSLRIKSIKREKEMKNDAFI
jgi:hypothetical protein